MTDLTRYDAADTSIPAKHGRGYVLRIEISASRRRHLGEMAREAGVSADALAALLLSDVIDDDEAAHRKESKRGERA